MSGSKQVKRVPMKAARRLIFIIAAFCVLVTVKNYRQTLEKQALMEANRQKIDVRSKEIKRTGDDIKRSGELEFAEKVAREDLGMIKPREVIYIDKEKDRLNDSYKEDVK